MLSHRHITGISMPRLFPSFHISILPSFHFSIFPFFHFAIIIFTLPLYAQNHGTNAGTLIRSEHGMVVSASPEASAVGAAILRAGGNAVDAAVATGFALAVTYPSAGNIGGGCYIVVHMADGREAAIDARETAPAAARRDMYLDSAGNAIADRSLYGPLSAGVPGSVDGTLYALEKFGSMSREELLRPAIHLAREGFPLHPRLAYGFRIYENEFRRYPSTWSIFAPEGKIPEKEFPWMQRDLAETLQRISDSGRDGFYRGETARRIVAAMQRDGGIISDDDLAGYRCIEREPLRGKYRQYQILTMPPSSSGGVALLQMLGIYERRRAPRLPREDAASAHYLIEAMRRAFADRAMFLGDPAFTNIPMAHLLSPHYIDSLFASIDPGKATASARMRSTLLPPREGQNTTHYSIVDRWGNAVSVTTTINSTYGSKYVVPGCGFLLNNEMDDFSARPGTPNQFGLLGSEANSIQPGKRMLSSMTPVIVIDNDTVRMVLGSPGGSKIITTVLQLFLNVFEYGMSLDRATAHPRFHHQWYPDFVDMEADAFTTETADSLRAMGHRLREDDAFGRVDAIFRDADGSLLGCSDPRGFGAAIAE
jgi:gamma-glutamyltranspeptidase/glutathione hydrolase